MKKKKLESKLAKVRGEAMPEVKSLIKKHGRTVVGWCMGQLRDYEKKVKQLEKIKAEAAKLEKEISR